MKAKPKFYVQARFPAERSWRNYETYASVHGALNCCDRLSATKDAFENRIFPNVRLRYRGFTLGRWKDGYQA